MKLTKWISIRDCKEKAVEDSHSWSIVELRSGMGYGSAMTLAESLDSEVVPCRPEYFEDVKAMASRFKAIYFPRQFILLFNEDFKGLPTCIIQSNLESLADAHTSLMNLLGLEEVQKKDVYYRVQSDGEALYNG